MKLSTVITVSMGLVVGAVIGIAKFSGDTSFPASLFRKFVPQPRLAATNPVKKLTTTNNQPKIPIQANPVCTTRPKPTSLTTRMTASAR